MKTPISELLPSSAILERVPKIWRDHTVTVSDNRRGATITAPSGRVISTPRLRSPEECRRAALFIAGGAIIINASAEML